MPAPVIGAVAAPVAGAIAGSLLGGNQPTASAAVPQDLRGTRAGQIQLLNYLLGFPVQDPRFAANQTPFQGTGGNFLQRAAQTSGFGSDQGGFFDGANPFNGGSSGGGLPNINPIPTDALPQGWGPQTGGPTPGGGTLPTPPGTGGLTPSRPSLGSPTTGGTAGQTGGMTPGGTPNPAIDRLNEFYGGIGMPQTPLQQQSVGDISTFLSDANNPFNRTIGQGLGALSGILGSNPGQPVIDALQPSFQRNLAEANQQGGRFGGANAILRSRALDDFNLLGAQIAQQGVNQQMQAANLANIFGNDQLGRLASAFGIGSAQAQQADVETQRRIQLLQSLLATAQGAAFGQPVTVSPSGTQQGLNAGLQFASLLPLLLGNKNGATSTGSPAPANNYYV